MSSTNKKALKSGVWYTISNFLSRGIVFITMPFFTRLMSKADIGDYANFTSWLTILATIITLDLYTSINVAKFEYRETLDNYIASILVSGSVITAVFYAVALLFSDIISSKVGLSTFEISVIFIYSMVSPAFLMIQIKNRLEFKYKVITALSLSSIVISTVCSLLCVVLLPDEKLTGRILGYYVPLFIFNVIIYLYILHKSDKIDFKYLIFGIRISLPLIFHALALSLLSSSDRVMIKNFCGSEDAAYYSVAYTCSLVVSVLWASMNMAWSPWAYDQMDKEEYGSLKKYSKPYILFFGAVVITFMIFAPELLLLLGGKSYYPALKVIPPVMVSFVFQFVYSLYVNIETYCKKQKNIAMGTIIAACINIVLNFIYIPVFGYAAAAYTTLVGYIVLFIIHFMFVRSMGKTSWYDTKFNLAFLAVFLVLMLAMNILYKLPILRYSLIAAIIIGGIVLLISFREEIAYLIKERSAKKILDRLYSKKRSAQ